MPTPTIMEDTRAAVERRGAADWRSSLDCGLATTRYDCLVSRPTPNRLAGQMTARYVHAPNDRLP